MDLHRANFNFLVQVELHNSAAILQQPVPSHNIIVIWLVVTQQKDFQIVTGKTYETCKTQQTLALEVSVYHIPWMMNQRCKVLICPSTVRTFIVCFKCRKCEEHKFMQQCFSAWSSALLGHKLKGAFPYKHRPIQKPNSNTSKPQRTLRGAKEC